MKAIKSYESGEFWGARYCEPIYEIEEEYFGEVKDLIIDRIKNNGLDYIPETIYIMADNGEDFEINTFDYLSVKDIKEIEKILEKELKND